MEPLKKQAIAICNTGGAIKIKCPCMDEERSGLGDTLPAAAASQVGNTAYVKS